MDNFSLDHRYTIEYKNISYSFETLQEARKFAEKNNSKIFDTAGYIFIK